MPMSITSTDGATTYASPFVGPVDHTVHVQVDVSALTSAEVDSKGYLKPGVVLTLAGVVPGASNTARIGVTVEATKIVAAGATLASVTADPLVAVATVGQINRDIAEDNLGRAYTANEIAALNGVGSSITLTTT